MTAAVVQQRLAPEGVPPCPYPGLRPFTKSEAKFFFGREEQRDECIRRLQDCRFLAITGTSGAGKSSLVRAGIISALDAGLLRGADDRWHHILFRPGANPMAALVRELNKLSGTTPPTLWKELLTSSDGLRQAIGRLNTDRRNILIVVDQFEELFRLGKDQSTPQRWAAERVDFVRSLLSAREQPDPAIHVVITMRTDFLDECTRFPELSEALNQGQFLVPRLSRAQLERAISEPATKVGVRMSRALVRKALGDAVDVSDPLPAIQHALMRTWYEWATVRSHRAAPSNEVQLADYEAVGAAREALDKHGNEVLASVSESDARVAKLLFERLTITDADQKVTRSPAPLRALVRLAESRGIPEAEAAVRRVVDRFRADECRFLMPPADEEIGDGTEIDITHEAVFRVWRTLSGSGPDKPGWIAEEHENGRAYARLAESARLKRNLKGQLLKEEMLVSMDAWWRRFQPTAAWASRYNVPDEEEQSIAERAKHRFLEIEQGSADGRRHSLATAYEEYRTERQRWQDTRITDVRKFLDDSLQAKERDERERQEMQAKMHAADAARVRGRLLSVVVAVVGAIVLGAALIVVLQARQLKGVRQDADSANQRAEAELGKLEKKRQTAEKERQAADRSARQETEALHETKSELKKAKDDLDRLKHEQSMAEKRTRTAKHQQLEAEHKRDLAYLPNPGPITRVPKEPDTLDLRGINGGGAADIRNRIAECLRSGTQSARISVHRDEGTTP